MVGTPLRSGGHNHKTAQVVPGDGRPEPPRKLTDKAQQQFDWLSERLGVDEAGAAWCRVDGALLATAAELMESQETVELLLQADPSDLKLHRLKGQLSDRVVRLSSLLGWCPRDRSRLPDPVPTDNPDDPFNDLLDRMSR
jgi:hypothetical protein